MHFIWKIDKEDNNGGTRLEIKGIFRLLKEIILLFVPMENYILDG
jgi:hypothetical protein